MKKSSYLPSGSIAWVMVRFQEVSKSGNPYVLVCRNGLLQVVLNGMIGKGIYAGIRFRQNLSLPLDYQQETFGEKLQYACLMNGKILSKMKKLSGHEIKNVNDLDGTYPCILGVQPNPFKGYIYNYIQDVVIPSDGSIWSMIHHYDEVIKGDCND
jgi:hypothetical protein